MLNSAGRRCRAHRHRGHLTQSGWKTGAPRRDPDAFGSSGQTLARLRMPSTHPVAASPCRFCTAADTATILSALPRPRARRPSASLARGRSAAGAWSAPSALTCAARCWPARPATMAWRSWAPEGYLINQFLVRKTNHRTDAWGGDFANRGAFSRRDHFPHSPSLRPRLCHHVPPEHARPRGGGQRLG